MNAIAWANAVEPRDVLVISGHQPLLAQGRVDHLAGRLESAEAHYVAAMSIAPGDPDLLHLRAALAWQRGRNVEAWHLVQDALQIRPKFSIALNTQGAIARSRGWRDVAIEAFASALAYSPDVLGFATNLATACMDAGQETRALDVLTDAIARHPHSAAARRALADALVRLRRPLDAIDQFLAAISLAPDDLEHRFGLAHARQLSGDLALAIDGYEGVLREQPDHLHALQNLGRAYIDAGSEQRGFDCLRRVLELAPGNAECWANMAVAQRRRGQLTEALALYAHAIKVDPQNVRTRYHHALTLLLAGDFSRGWVEHEWRMRLPEFPIRHDLLQHNLWDGGPLGERTLLLHAEQGLGDTIQFARYATVIALRGLKQFGTVVLMVPAALVSLLQGLPGVELVTGISGATPEFDVQAPLLSLPGLLGTDANNVPAAIPYLRACESRSRDWRMRLAPAGLRVGIVWAGNPTHGNDRERSLSPSVARDLASRILAARQDLLLVGLQVGARLHDLDSIVGGERYHCAGDRLTSFEDTVALLGELDVVVTVDTSVAHLAGALGRPTFVLLPFAPDWRWRDTGDRTAWYPTMRLFRAPAQGDIDAAIGDVVTAIAALNAGAAS